MANVNSINRSHIAKLGHNLEEIRIRTLDNVIVKYERGFGCDCQVLKKQLIECLFNWFNVKNVPCPDKVLAFLRLLVKDTSYVQAFGRSRLQRELCELRKTIVDDSSLLRQLDEIDRDLGLLESTPQVQVLMTQATETSEGETYSPAMNHHGEEDSSLGETDKSREVLDGTEINSVETGIKWLVMPWQPLITSDRNVFESVEKGLADRNATCEICKVITNVMLQDFPAELFLQRPAIVTILLNLLNTDNADNNEANSEDCAILRALNKLTRSLRFRIYYYCDPCVANKKQKAVISNADEFNQSDDRESPDGGLPEVNYQAFQSAGSSDNNNSHSESNQLLETYLQRQQMFIPVYCLECLKSVMVRVCDSVAGDVPSKNSKYLLDLAQEAVQLLIISISPTIWLCSDEIATAVQENFKVLLDLLGQVVDYLVKTHGMIYRSLLLNVSSLVVDLLGNLVPLELTTQVIPDSLQSAICQVLMDAPIYLMHPALHSTLLDYARQFHGRRGCESLELYDQIGAIMKSLRASMRIVKSKTRRREAPPSVTETLKTLYESKSSWPLLLNNRVIKECVLFLSCLGGSAFDEDGGNQRLAVNLTLSLLASGGDVQRWSYEECHSLVRQVTGVNEVDSGKKLCWESIKFLFNSSVLTEIICHGVTSDDELVSAKARDIVIYLLKSRVHVGNAGWSRFLEALVPVLPLLQSHAAAAAASTDLGKCASQMLDPDVYAKISLPRVEAFRGNLRLLFAKERETREEAVNRLTWFLEHEENSRDKLPRLSSLHGLPLDSLCTVKRQTTLKHANGIYERGKLLTLLEILKSPVDPKLGKSTLLQLSVVLSDSSLHRHFLREDGLTLVTGLLDSCLSERDCNNYADSSITIVTILKTLSMASAALRGELSSRLDVLTNVLRTLFQYPNNEAVRADATQLLAILLFHDYAVTLESHERFTSSNVSLPQAIVAGFQLPFTCRSHWKSSVHGCDSTTTADASIVTSSETSLRFLRIFWAWIWHGGDNLPWKSTDELNNNNNNSHYYGNVSDKLKLKQTDLQQLQFTAPLYVCQQQLYNIQNATTHQCVNIALNYLAIYAKLYYRSADNLTHLPWEETFERFLVRPVNREDYDLFVNILNFLCLYVDVRRRRRGGGGGCSSDIDWLCKITRSLARSLGDLFNNCSTVVEMDNQEMHQAILKLVRTCSSTIDDNDAAAASSNNRQQQQGDENDTWMNFIRIIVSNFCSDDNNQQRFYNLVYIDWLLTCLTYLTSKCQWDSHEDLLSSLGKALMELITSFHKAETVSFKGVTIIRNSIICLNHVLHQMQQNSTSEKSFMSLWYAKMHSLSWLPTLWRNRDPLVRAAAYQLLGGLVNHPQTANQLVQSIVMAPSDLCHTLLTCIVDTDECCIVKEQACIALGNLTRSCALAKLQYVDILKPEAIIIYTEQSNVYEVMANLCGSLHLQSNLNLAQKPLWWTLDSSSLLPEIIHSLYGNQDIFNEGAVITITSHGESESEQVPLAVATPSLITSLCNLLNNLLAFDAHDVIREIRKFNLDKCLLRCFHEMPKMSEDKQNENFQCDLLEMYSNICQVLTSCIIQSEDPEGEQSTIPVETFHLLFHFLNVEIYEFHSARLVYLRDKLLTSLYILVNAIISVKSVPLDLIESALRSKGAENILLSMLDAMASSKAELKYAAISCLGSLLSLSQKNNDYLNMKELLDSFEAIRDDCQIARIINGMDKIALSPSKSRGEKGGGDADCETICTIGSELCKILLIQYEAHALIANRKKSNKLRTDRDIVFGALANVLCVSHQAKMTALTENSASIPSNLVGKIYNQFKQCFVEFKIQPSMEISRKKSDLNAKMDPGLQEINNLLFLAMNFMYNCIPVKMAFAEVGLADVLHKLWDYISLSNVIVCSALKLLITLTVDCDSASQSLVLTTKQPGTAMRKTPNTVSLLHEVIYLIMQEIERINRESTNHNAKELNTQKIHYGFNLLRNVVSHHDCRVIISKSNLLQLFGKIHPEASKRAKSSSLIDEYFLEFLMDFTYYEEGQVCVPKAMDSMEVLIGLSKGKQETNRLLALSVLRNLTFNTVNRGRFISSVNFLHLLRETFKSNDTHEIELCTLALWSLVCNNHRGKLVARTAGFPASIDQALARLSLLHCREDDAENDNESEKLIGMLQYLGDVLSVNKS